MVGATGGIGAGAANTQSMNFGESLATIDGLNDGNPTPASPENAAASSQDTLFCRKTLAGKPSNIGNSLNIAHPYTA